MTTTQSFKIYELLNRYFKNDSDAKAVVQEIETIIENKFEKETTSLFTKEDGFDLKKQILELTANQERRFNNVIMWTVSTGIAVVGILIAVLRMLPLK